MFSAVFLLVALVLFLIAAFNTDKPFHQTLGYLGLAATTVGLGALKVFGLA